MPEVGQRYLSRQKQHPGWVVRVLHVGKKSVCFRIEAGPGHATGSRHWMGIQSFRVVYRRLG